MTLHSIYCTYGNVGGSGTWRHLFTVHFYSGLLERASVDLLPCLPFLRIPFCLLHGSWHSLLPPPWIMRFKVLLLFHEESHAPGRSALCRGETRKWPLQEPISRTEERGRHDKRLPRPPDLQAWLPWLHPPPSWLAREQVHAWLFGSDYSGAHAEFRPPQ